MARPTAGMAGFARLLRPTARAEIRHAPDIGRMTERTVVGATIIDYDLTVELA
jgi:hypothetical protein